jgi:ankyrin repeat protein
MVDKTFEMENAAIDNDLEKVIEIVREGVDQKVKDAGLSSAVAYSNLTIAEYLVNHGADIEWGEYDPLYWACHNGEFEGIKFVLDKGVDINVRNGLILTMGVVGLNAEALQWIIDRGADVNINEGKPLVNAIIYNKPLSVEVLLKNQAELTQKAIAEAEDRRRLEILELFKKYKNFP